MTIILKIRLLILKNLYKNNTLQLLSTSIRMYFSRMQWSSLVVYLFPKIYQILVSNVMKESNKVKVCCVKSF